MVSGLHWTADRIQQQRECFIHAHDNKKLISGKNIFDLNVLTSYSMSQPSTPEDMKQEVKTAEAMKAADYSKPDLQNKANKTIHLSNKQKE